MKHLYNRKLFIVVNVDWFFLSHRLPIALAAKQQGLDVTIVAADTGKKDEIISFGLNFIDMPFQRSGSSISHELKCIKNLSKLYKKENPDIIHHVTLKASLLGSIAARLGKKRHVINAISGFGYNFTEGRKSFLQKIIRLVMKFIFKSNYFHFIFQNPDDINQFKSLKLIPEKNIHLIKGSGIDLNQFQYAKEPDNTLIKFLLPARMLYDKGIVEFITAAASLKPILEKKATFVLAGSIDFDNLAMIPEEKLQAMLDKDYIQWIGHQENIYKTIADSHVVVLPSYREGLPKSLIEACAVGRPIITTNSFGCKECVEDGVNGFLVPIKDTKILAEKMLLLAENTEMRKEMGIASRKLAEKEFSIESVIDKTFEIYQKMLG